MYTGKLHIGSKFYAYFYNFQPPVYVLHLPKIIKKVRKLCIRRFTGTRYKPANTDKICTHKLKGIGILTTHLPVTGTYMHPAYHRYMYIVHALYAIHKHNNDYSVTI